MRTMSKFEAPRLAVCVISCRNATRKKLRCLELENDCDVEWMKLCVAGKEKGRNFEIHCRQSPIVSCSVWTRSEMESRSVFRYSNSDNMWINLSWQGKQSGSPDARTSPCAQEETIADPWLVFGLVSRRASFRYSSQVCDRECRYQWWRSDARTAVRLVVGQVRDHCRWQRLAT